MQRFEYTNRKGVTYYLHSQEGRGRSVRYTLKRSMDGALAEFPPGHEVVENVNGRASVRRIRARQINPGEETSVRSVLARCGLHAYRLEVKGPQITIFGPDRDPTAIASRFNPLELMPAGIGQQVEAMLRGQLGDAAVDQYLRERRESLRRQLETTLRYEPVLRFRLVDRKARRFEVARMTYGGEGGWHALGVGPLAAAAKKYLKHLGRDSFFELV